jgi:N-acetylmuramoyl-L-alanine amidase
MLQVLAIYLLKMITCSGLLFMYYWASLRNKRFHYYNRFYLLMCVVLSIILPMLNLQLFIFKSNSDNAIQLLNVIYSSGENDVVSRGVPRFNWQQFLTIGLFAVTACMMFSLGIRILKIYRFKKVYPVNKSEEFDFINTDLSQAPFSFLKNIFWRNDISIEEATGQQILQHELTHIRQKHTWDKLFMQIVLCVLWMNPVYWFIRSELYFIHEFIADEKAVSNKDASAFAAMLLQAQYGKSIFSPAQSFFYSPIKRRLLMLTTSREPRFSYARRILTLPLLIGVVLLFAFRLQKESDQPIIKANSPFKLVVDAGHGGTDNGAVTSEGIKEKDINLMITKKIKELSSEYNIDVILTRDDDATMSAQEKVNYSNAHEPDAFVSIHVNNQESDETVKKSGMEVCISPDNIKYDESKLLGSAIIQNLKTDFTINNSLVQRKVGIWVLKANAKPSILIECGYLNNDSDLKILNDASKVEQIAREILQGVAMYANHKIKGSQLNSIQLEGSVSDSTEPKFPGGPEAWANYLEKNVNLKVLTDKKAPPGNYTVIVTFLIDDEGNVSEVKALNDPGYGSADEAVWVITNSGKWIPATENGKPATYRQKQSITFRIDEPQKNKTFNSNDLSDTANTLLKTGTVKFTPPLIVKDTNFVKASFPGGHDAWEKLLEKNLKSNIPVDKGSPPGTYKVVVSFMVDATGKVSKVKADNDPGYGTAEEAVRVIANGPDWVPAKNNNSPVSSVVKQDITFEVSEQ